MGGKREREVIQAWKQFSLNPGPGIVPAATAQIPLARSGARRRPGESVGQRRRGVLGSCRAL